jgi:ZIP family zinc transporter
MHPAVFLPFFSTIAGGFAALRLQHRLHALMALASGVVVATAIVDLLPEAFELAGFDRVVEVGIAAVAGFIGFSFLEAFLHQSSFEHADEDHDAGAQLTPRRNGHGLIGLLPPTSLVVHSALDGLVIGLAFQAGDEIGLIVLLAVVGAGVTVSFLGLELLDLIALGGAAVMGVAFFVRAFGNLRVLAEREPYTVP